MTDLATSAIEITALLLVVSLQVVLARWVMHDAEDRRLNLVLWGAVVFTTGFIGLATYLWLHRLD